MSAARGRLHSLRVRGCFALMLVSLAFAIVRPASAGTLEQALAASPEGAWVEYDVALLPGDGSPCCFDWRNDRMVKRGCSLDSKNWSFGTNSDELRGSDVLRVFLRKGEGSVDRVRSVGGDCPIDKGALTVREVANVTDAESVAALARLAGSDRAKHRGESLAALALHADRTASDALATMARSGGSEARGDALFWLSQRGDPIAERVILEAISPENPVEVQKKAIFALSQLPEDRAVPALRDIVQSDRPRAVRKEAIFWLAQTGSDEAFAVFDEILK